MTGFTVQILQTRFSFNLNSTMTPRNYRTVLTGDDENYIYLQINNCPVQNLFEVLYPYGLCEGKCEKDFLMLTLLTEYVKRSRLFM